MYTIDLLSQENPSIIITHQELTFINTFIYLIKNTRNISKPQTYDIVEYVNKYGEFSINIYYDLTIENNKPIYYIYSEKFKVILKLTKTQYDIILYYNKYFNFETLQNDTKNKFSFLYNCQRKFISNYNGKHITFKYNVNVWSCNTSEQPYGITTKTHTKLNILTFSKYIDSKYQKKDLMYTHIVYGKKTYYFKTQDDFENWKKSIEAIEVNYNGTEYLWIPKLYNI